MTRRDGGTDQQIQRAVVKRLDWSALVRSEHIGVTVTDGAVTLAGEANGRAEKTAAVAEATRVQGVRAIVDNHIAVRPLPTVAQTEAHTAAALAQATEMEVTYIRIDIDGDEVTLQGSVHSWYARRAAERAARSAPGITDLHNQLVVTL